MMQDMKKDTILHTGKGTYIHRLMNVCSSAYERMFIGTWTYVLEQASPSSRVSPSRPASTPVVSTSSSLPTVVTLRNYLSDSMEQNWSRKRGEKIDSTQIINRVDSFDKSSRVN